MITVEIRMQIREDLFDSEQKLIQTVSASLHQAYDDGDSMPVLILKRFEDFFWLLQSNRQLVEQIDRLRAEIYKLVAENESGSLGGHYIYQAYKDFGRESLSSMIPASYKPMSWPKRELREVSGDNE